MTESATARIGSVTELRSASHRYRRPAPEPLTPYAPLARRPLPAGRPRHWYITHNRRLKAMRLAIALLDSGTYLPTQASNEKIRRTAEQVGIRPPSDATCRMVRTMLRYSR
ncbi:hypothetical protein [Nocardia harenae]|uniref:hypothetical protein n=1 Tax=Nocardia harenae TaxID=358707 RepID=UPI000ADBAE24|nr:hypothetical protein [Nocardia harenae]